MKNAILSSSWLSPELASLRLSEIGQSTTMWHFSDSR